MLSNTEFFDYQRPKQRSAQRGICLVDFWTPLFFPFAERRVPDGDILVVCFARCEERRGKEKEKMKKKAFSSSQRNYSGWSMSHLTVQYTVNGPGLGSEHFLIDPVSRQKRNDLQRDGTCHAIGASSSRP